MNQVFYVKLLNGEVKEINCEALELKKNILLYEQSIELDYLMLYDEDLQTIISQQKLMNRQSRQYITLIDVQKAVKELNITKVINQNKDKLIQELKNKNSNVLSIINQQNQRIQLLKSDLEKIEQEKNKVILTLKNQINELTEEHEEQLKIINNNRFKTETDLNNQIEGLYGQILQLQENQGLKQQVKLLNQEKNRYQQALKQQRLQLNREIEELTQSLEISQETIKKFNADRLQSQLYQEQINQYYKQCEQQFQTFLIEQQLQEQASLQALNEEKVQLAQKCKKDAEEFQRKQRQFKIEKEEQDEILNKLTKDLSAYKAQLADGQKKFANSNQQVKKLEEEIEELTRGKMNEIQIIQMRDKEIKKLKEEIAQLNQNLQSEQDQNDIQRNQYINLQKEKQTISDQLNEEIHQLNESITELTATIGSKTTQIDGLQKQVATQSILLKNSQEEQKNLQKQLVDLKIKIQDEASKGDGANRALRDVKLQLSARIKDIEQLNENLDQALKKQQEVSLENNSLKGKLTQLQLQHESLQKDYNEAKSSIQVLSETNRKLMEDFTKQIQDDQQRFRAEIEYKNIIIKKVCKNQQDKYIDKIIGPMEKIMNSEFKINRYQEDPNNKRDNTEYIVYEISIDKIKALNLIKGQKWICFDECLQYYTLGSAKTIRSIQPNADVTLLKGYIIQIEEADNAVLKDKKLLRKEYKSQATPMLSTKEEAGKLSLNNLICKFLLEKYNQMQGFPKIQGKQIQFQKQFVLQIKGKEEYCYCEMIEEGQFEKINGGAFQVKDTDIHQYLNAFSLFTYHIMNRQLIISNLQVIGQYLHDMIVSTQYKIFTPIDQGSAEIAQTMGILEKAPQAALSKFWNEKIEQQIRQGWK